jgi:hypothetical protein
MTPETQIYLTRLRNRLELEWEIFCELMRQQFAEYRANVPVMRQLDSIYTSPTDTTVMWVCGDGLGIE